MVCAQHDAKLDYYGRKLATCSSDRSIKVFDVNPDGSHSQTASIAGCDAGRAARRGAFAG